MVKDAIKRARKAIAEMFPDAPCVLAGCRWVYHRRQTGLPIYRHCVRCGRHQYHQPRYDELMGKYGGDGPPETISSLEPTEARRP